MMGYDTGKIEISYRTSAHNSEQDDADKQAVEDLLMEIEAMVTRVSEYRRVVSSIRG